MRALGIGKQQVLSEEEVAGLRNLFRSMDVEGTGSISVKHIRERLGEERQLHASRRVARGPGPIPKRGGSPPLPPVVSLCLKFSPACSV